MVAGGPTWIPPNPVLMQIQQQQNPIPPIKEEEKNIIPAISTEKKEDSKVTIGKFKEKGLTPELHEDFEIILKLLSIERKKIKEAMAFIIENSEYWSEITTILCESILLPGQLINKKVAKIYLLSDVLYNSSAPVPNASMFRAAFQPKLEQIFENLNETLKGIQGRITAEHMKEQILRVLRVWNSWSLYPPTLITQLNSLFLKGQKQITEKKRRIKRISQTRFC